MFRRRGLRDYVSRRPMVSIQHIFGVDVCLERQCMLRVIVAVYCCVREMSVIVRDTACMGRCPLYWSVDVTDSEEHGPPAWSVQFRAWSASLVSSCYNHYRTCPPDLYFHVTAIAENGPSNWCVHVMASGDHGPPAWSVQLRAWSASFISMLRTVFCMVRQLDVYMLLSVSYMVCQCWSVRDS